MVGEHFSAGAVGEGLLVTDREKIGGLETATETRNLVFAYMYVVCEIFVEVIQFISFFII